MSVVEGFPGLLIPSPFLPAPREGRADTSGQTLRQRTFGASHWMGLVCQGGQVGSPVQATPSFLLHKEKRFLYFKTQLAV